SWAALRGMSIEPTPARVGRQGVTNGAETSAGGCGAGRVRLDGRDPGTGADGRRARGSCHRAWRLARYAEPVSHNRGPGRDPLVLAQGDVPVDGARDADLPKQPQPDGPADAALGLL